ncbi:unnamed protein product [Miscanthus lutarioriparius]|uniref:Uncharacterized protein n=1 Tax=Miscanthus lutarioriparius TaxID=422564 RepID=A0A811RRJ9_9POAL|nr:unnamed protein product [Miscanthus lutarioriparius]
MATGASPSAIGVMSNAELTAAVLDLGKMVVGIHAFLLGPQGPQPIPPPPPTQQQLSLPPLPAWIAGLSKPIYTAPVPAAHLPPLPTIGAVMAHGGAPAPGVLYGGVDGPLFHGGSLMPTLSAASPSLDSTGAAPSASAQDTPPVALSCAEDLDLVRCVGDLGHAVSPTGGGHAIFPWQRRLGRIPPPRSPSEALRSSVRCRPAAVWRGEGVGSPARAHHVAPSHGRCCDHF